MPPGQGRKLLGYSDPYANWYGSPYWYWGGDNYDWSYWDGYAYRINRDSGLIVAFIPLLGGALFVGNVWPGYYADYDVTPYYADYYGDGYGPDYGYRYADDTIFAVAPDSQRIEAVVGLLAGDDWVVGSPMPAGYDFYNIPPDYRDRYVDGDDAWYRYSDGYVYEIDPRSFVVRRSIELVG